MAGFTNGDGNYHEKERREEWYSNKEIFEKMGFLADRFTSMEKAIIRFENKFEEYNGLHEKLQAIELRPCRQDSEIKEISKLVKEVWQEREFKYKMEEKKRKTEEKKYKTAAYVGSLVGIAGGFLGILALLGVL